MNLLLQRPRNRRLVLNSAGIPTVIDLSCQEHTFSVRVRVMSEYGKFRRADLEPHFPLRLGARLLQPSPKGLTLKRNDSGQVRDCGHGDNRKVALAQAGRQKNRMLEDCGDYSGDSSTMACWLAG